METRELRAELRRHVVGDQVPPVIRRLVTQLLDLTDYTVERLEDLRKIN
jgi:hypothetical protein